MSGKVKVAVVGVSGYGDSYLESVLGDSRNAGIELIGVADPAPSRCRRLDVLQARRVPFFSSMTALYEEVGAPDLVMLATPIHLHAPQTIFAVRNGSSVLCEKPLAGSLADACRMMEAEQLATGSVGRFGQPLFVAIGFQWSFNSAIQTLKRDIAAGVLGKPLRLKSLVSFPRGQSYYARNEWAGRIRTASGLEVLDSPLNNAAAHYLHNMLFLLGDTANMAASAKELSAELYRANPIENYDTCALRLRAGPDATEVLFYTTHAMAEKLGPRSVFEFEHAVVSHDAGDTGEFVARFRDGRVKNYGNPGLDRHEKIWQCVESVRSGVAPFCGVAGAMPHMLCALAAQKSGDVVTLPAASIETVETGEDTMRAVRGLQSLFTACFDRAELPAETGLVPWAVRARSVKVNDVVSGSPSSANEKPQAVSV